MASRISYEPVKELIYTSFGGLADDTFALVGSLFTHPIRQITIQNLTDVSLWFSLDGRNEFLMLPTKGYQTLDITTNKPDYVSDSAISVGLGIYVKYKTNAPTATATPDNGVFVSSIIYQY